MFSSHVAECLGYYVYRLIDPRNGETFYIGKGKGNRVFAHAKGELTASENSDTITEKLQRIREIRRDDFEVAHVIHRHGMNEETAFEVEAALIDAYPEASNLANGRYSDDRGVLHSKQIIEHYEAKEATFEHKAIAITVGVSLAARTGIYDAVRYAWKIDPKKASQAELIVAVRQGLIIGVFVAEQWLEATHENFPEFTPCPGRWGFIGRDAPASVAKQYLRHRLPNSMRKRGAANPVKYTF